MKIVICFTFLITIVARLHAQNITLTPSVLSPPRHSYEAILAIPNPQDGDLVYDITFNCIRVYTGGKWYCNYQQPGDFTPNISCFASGGGAVGDANYAIAVDDSGNVYVTGYFNGTATFGTATVVSQGGNDVFLAKYNNGGQLQWIKSAGGTANESGILGKSIGLDSNGNIYITGTYTGTATFDGTSITSSGSFEIFVAKYSNNGSFQWVQSAGGIDSDNSNGIAVDASGNAYITGFYIGTAIFGSASITSAGNNDVFVAKYSSSGSLLWVRSAGGATDDYAHGVALSSLGNVYITGSYTGTATFGNVTKTSKGGNDVFLVQYSSNGILSFFQTAGGAGYESGFGIVFDKNDNIYVAGAFNGTTSFGNPIFNGPISKTSAGENDIFVAKFDQGVLDWTWVQSAGGASSEFSYGVAVDPSNNIYITGFFTGTANFSGITKVSAGSDDIFVAKYNSRGNFQWVQSAGGSMGDNGNGIAIDKNGYVYVAGGYSNLATFGRTSRTTLGLHDAFIMKLDK